MLILMPCTLSCVRCRLVVEISLEQGQVHLVVQARGARLILQSPVVLSVSVCIGIGCTYFISYVPVPVVFV